jgi:hypothetical protein
MYMKTSQLAVLKQFYQVATRGSDVFIFPDQEAYTPGPPPVPFPTVYCRFTGAPSISATPAPGVWSVGLSMEIIP